MEPRRNQRPDGGEMVLRVRLERDLIEKNKQVRHDQQDRDEGRGVTALPVFEWKHLVSRNGSGGALRKIRMRPAFGALNETAHAVEAANPAARAELHAVQSR